MLTAVVCAARMLAAQLNIATPRDPEVLALGKTPAMVAPPRCLGGTVSVEQDIGQDQERLLPRDVRGSRSQRDGGRQAKPRPRRALEKGVVFRGELFGWPYRMACPGSRRGR